MSPTLKQRLSADDFRHAEHKSITLIGMSGVGKTMLANKLPRDQWFHYSVDYRIGSYYLDEAISDMLKKEAMKIPLLQKLLRSNSIYLGNNISFNDLSPLSAYVGKIGDSNRGGSDFDGYMARQNAHRDAEIRAMYDIDNFIHKAQDIYGYPHFLNDTGGSMCELNDPDVLRHTGQHSLIIYIEADDALEAELSRRAVAHPKPMYYQESFIRNEVDTYIADNNLNDAQDINPDEFGRWIFPRHLAHRKPLYRAIAQQYGYCISAQAIAQIKDQDEFIELVADTIREAR